MVDRSADLWKRDEKSIGGRSILVLPIGCIFSMGESPSADSSVGPGCLSKSEKSERMEQLSDISYMFFETVGPNANKWEVMLFADKSPLEKTMKNRSKNFKHVLIYHDFLRR